MRRSISAFGVPYSDALKERFIAYLARSYECLLQNLPGKVSELHVFMTMRTLERDLAGSVRSVYRQLGIPLTPQFARQLKKCAEGAKRPRPPHRYMLVELGLNRDEIVRRFADVYRCYDFSDSEIKRLGLDAERGASPTAMSRIV